jgi:hypothetical protein
VNEFTKEKRSGENVANDEGYQNRRDEIFRTVLSKFSKKFLANIKHGALLWRITILIQSDGLLSHCKNIFGISQLFASGIYLDHAKRSCAGVVLGSYRTGACFVAADSAWMWRRGWRWTLQCRHSNHPDQ